MIFTVNNSHAFPVIHIGYKVVLWMLSQKYYGHCGKLYVYHTNYIYQLLFFLKKITNGHFLRKSCVSIINTKF